MGLWTYFFLGPKALVFLDEKAYHISMGKFFLKITKRATALALVLVFLFNTGAPAFAAFKQENDKEKQVREELKEVLEDEYAKKEKLDPTEEALKDCLQGKYYSQCEAYIDKINELFTDTRDTIESGKQPKEESFTPISKREYKKQLQKNTEQEYKKQVENIEKKYQEESKILEYKYRGTLLNTPEYSKYVAAVSELKKWQKDNMENISSWKQEVFQDEDKYYQEYLKKFEKSVNEYNAEKEKVLREYFKELADNLMKVYEKVPATMKLKLVDLFVMILSIESEDTKFFTSAQRSEIYKFFNSVLTPTSRLNTRINPCRFHTRPKTEEELAPLRVFDEREARIERDTRELGGLSVRDQVAAQTRGMTEGLRNYLQAPVTEVEDEAACSAAFSALNGLSYYKTYWNMGSVIAFMLDNLYEPMSSTILLMGTKTLIESGRIDQLEAFRIGLANEEIKYATDDKLNLKEATFFDNKFYHTPDVNSRYSETDGGGDAFRDMAEMLAKEKTPLSEQMQHRILDTSISLFFRNKISFYHHIPLVYGIILNNPKVIDSFVPNMALAITGEGLPFGTGYHYGSNNKVVYYDYFEDHIAIYYRDPERGKVYLPDDAEVSKIPGLDADQEHKVKKVAELRNELFDEHTKNKQKYLEAYKSNFINKKPSEFFAEAFYNADFVDLTAEEKFAMDKALEKKYPYLKKISKGHKQKLEDNRRGLAITNVVIGVIDIALTVWCVADIYKLIKWGAKGIQTLRLLIKAGKTSATLSTTRRIAFFRTIIKENKNVLTLNRKIKKIKSVPSRIANKFPAYTKGVELTRMSHDGQRVLTVVKLDGTPVMMGKYTPPTPTTAIVKAETKTEAKAATSAQETSLTKYQKPTLKAEKRPFTFNNMFREIKVASYLAKKNGMSFTKYVFNNLFYRSGREMALTNDMLRIEGMEKAQFFRSNYYIPSIHKDIFRINRDMARASKLGISELGEGGTILSYVEESKMPIFREYTLDYINGLDLEKIAAEQVANTAKTTTTRELMSGQISLLPRKLLYDKAYAKVLPFVQEKHFSKIFNLSERVYAAMTKEGFYFYNTATRQIFRDLTFHTEGFLSQNNLLASLYAPVKNTTTAVARTNSGVRINLNIDIEEATAATKAAGKEAATGADIVKTSAGAGNREIVKSGSSSSVLNKTKNFLFSQNPLFPAINKTVLFAGMNLGNILNLSALKTNFNINLPPPQSALTAQNAAAKTVLAQEENIFLSKSDSEMFKPGDPLPPVTYTGPRSAGKDDIAVVANELIGKMLIYGVSQNLTGQRLTIYNDILDEIYGVLKFSFEDPSSKLKKVLEKANFFMTTQPPIMVLRGYGLDYFKPKHIETSDFFINTLAYAEDFKQQLAQDIRTFSSVQKEYTVYIEMHGGKDGLIAIEAGRYTNLNEILDIIEANKGDAKVNVISGACHSGAALGINLVRKDINVLLLSGLNDVCTITDFDFINLKDLRSTYINAIENKYYGAYLVYEGKTFNTLRDTRASLAKGNPLIPEIDIFSKIYFSREPLGLSIYKLLSTLPKYQTPKYSFTDLLHSVFVPPDFIKDASYNTFLRNNKDGWSYMVQGERKGLDFTEPQEETSAILASKAKDAITKAFPKWKYDPVKEITPKDSKTGVYVLSAESSLQDVSLGNKILDFFAPKTPENIASSFAKKGVSEQYAKDIAQACFEGAEQKYNALAFDKATEFLQKGVEPKYINTMIEALSENGKFSKELYDRAMALQRKHNLSLPESVYLTNLAISLTGYNKEIYASIDKLLEKNFDFTTIKNEMIPEKELRDLVENLEDYQIDMLSVFAKGGKTFDIEKWHNLVYIANQTKENYSTLQYAMQHYLSLMDTLEPAISVLGIDLVSQAIKSNYTRYTNTFRDFIQPIEPDLLPLLKANIQTLSSEEKLHAVYLLSGSVNKTDFVLDKAGKIALINKLPDMAAFKKEINKIIFKQLKYDYTDELAEIFDFASNRYADHILKGNYDFYANMTLLMEIIKANPGKPVKQILDELPENKALAKLCEENGIDYQAWRGYDPDFFITREVEIKGPAKKTTMTVRKIDMDNIMKGLTSGNESSSCRGIGPGECSASAPNLIKNKSVQQIEIIVNGRAVGNMLLYLADVDGEIALVMGSFVKRPIYESHDITKLILDYVKQIRDSISSKKIPIYYSAYLEKENFFKFPLSEHKVNVIGDSYDDIFYSFMHEFVRPAYKEVINVELYLVDDGKAVSKLDKKKVNFSLSDNINVPAKTLSKEEVVSFYKDKKINENLATKLAEKCFDGGIFNKEIFDLQQKLLEQNQRAEDIEKIIENLSSRGGSSLELYEKSLELTKKYGDNLLNTSKFVSYCMQKGSFDTVVYEKIKLMYDKYVPFSKLAMLESCTVNGKFRADLFDKAIAIPRQVSLYAPKIITAFLDKSGKFNDKYWQAVFDLVEATKTSPTAYDGAMKEFLAASADLNKAFDLLGVQTVKQLVIKNKKRYLGIFEELFKVLDEENLALLKRKISPLSVEKKLQAITLLAGSINKKSEILNKEGIKDLINKIPNEKKFKEAVNQLVFKQLNLEYTPALAEIFDFSSNKYISKILSGDIVFDRRLAVLFEDLSRAKGKNIHQKFDSFPENKSLAKMCEKEGINYQGWRSYDPNDKMTRVVVVNKGKEPIAREEITVQKVNMDDVVKALTTGNESGACRSCGKKNFLPDLVRNKMVQQIEYLDNNKVVGNTLIYLAKVDGETAIVIGSIIKKFPYYASAEINELIIDYVRNMRKELGKPDMPIYLSNHFALPDEELIPIPYPSEVRKMTLIGDGDLFIFNSLSHKQEIPARKKVNKLLLYKVDEKPAISNANFNKDGLADTYLSKDITFEQLSKKNKKKFNFLPTINNDFLAGIPVFKLEVFNGNNYASGTGFYLKYLNLPFILTAGHVVKDNLGQYLTVFNDKGFSMRSKILNVSDKSDLAILSVPDDRLLYADPWTLALKEPSVGDKLFSVGYPNSLEKQENNLSLLKLQDNVNGNTHYLHEKGTLTFGASGSPLTKDRYSKELLGVVIAADRQKNLAASVPLPQIKNFLWETVKKIISVPELSEKYISLYPAFARNFENILTNKDLYKRYFISAQTETAPLKLASGFEQARAPQETFESYIERVKQFIEEYGYFPTTVKRKNNQTLTAQQTLSHLLAVRANNTIHKGSAEQKKIILDLRNQSSARLIMAKQKLVEYKKFVETFQRNPLLYKNPKGEAEVEESLLARYVYNVQKSKVFPKELKDEFKALHDKYEVKEKKFESFYNQIKDFGEEYGYFPIKVKIKDNATLTPEQDLSNSLNTKIENILYQGNAKHKKIIRDLKKYLFFNVILPRQKLAEYKKFVETFQRNPHKHQNRKNSMTKEEQKEHNLAIYVYEVQKRVNISQAIKDEFKVIHDEYEVERKGVNYLYNKIKKFIEDYGYFPTRIRYQKEPLTAEQDLANKLGIKYDNLLKRGTEEEKKVLIALKKQESPLIKKAKQRLKEYKEFIETFDRNPIRYSYPRATMYKEEIEEVRLAKYIYNIQHARTIPQEIKDEFKALYQANAVKKRNADEVYNALTQFINENGRFPQYYVLGNTMEKELNAAKMKERNLNLDYRRIMFSKETAPEVKEKFKKLREENYFYKTPQELLAAYRDFCETYGHAPREISAKTLVGEKRYERYLNRSAYTYISNRRKDETLTKEFKQLYEKYALKNNVSLWIDRFKTFVKEHDCLPDKYTKRLEMELTPAQKEEAHLASVISTLLQDRSLSVQDKESLEEVRNIFYEYHKKKAPTKRLSKNEKYLDDLKYKNENFYKSYY